MIVDAQAHLWKAEAPDRPWLPGRVAQLPEPFLIEKLVPMMDDSHPAVRYKAAAAIVRLTTPVSTQPRQ